MHYYKRNLGDYAKKAGRLSMLQHGSYTLLIDACYDREQFPTLEEAIEWTWASTADEIEAVTFVLRKFFTLENGVYVQKRLQEEITEYQGKAATNKRIALEREANRAVNNTNRARTVDDACKSGDEPPPNHKPLTINHKPKHRVLRFSDFWSAYPKKVGKDAALKQFNSRKVDDALLAEMLTALAIQKQSPGWQKDGGQFIPNPATWLSQGRWQDEAVASANDDPYGLRTAVNA